MHALIAESFSIERLQKTKEEDLMKNASQRSINQQILPLIEERILSELPGPPLPTRLSLWYDL
jgi:hypothetical protein